jgi:hypothetical protein
MCSGVCPLARIQQQSHRTKRHLDATPFAECPYMLAANNQVEGTLTAEAMQALRFS